MALSRLEKDRTDGLLSQTTTPGGGKEKGTGTGGVSSPLSFGEELQFWPPEKDGSQSRLEKTQ